MAAPSKEVVQLMQSVATLTERIDGVRNEIQNLADLFTKVALLEREVSELREIQRKRVDRIWMIVVALIGPIVGGIVGSVLTFLAQMALKQLPK
jgi:integral membrane sensor domain MASE1